MSKNEVVDLFKWLDIADSSEENEEKEDDEEKLKKRVNFNLKPQIHILYKWNTAYKLARQKYWEIIALDHYRFKQRIQNINDIISKILDSNHRKQIFYERFSNQLKF